MAAAAKCSSRVSLSWLLRTSSSWVLSISKDGDSTTSLGNLVCCLTPLLVRKCFLALSWDFMCFNLCPLPLVLPVGTSEK